MRQLFFILPRMIFIDHLPKLRHKKKSEISLGLRGAYGTRTRDPMRDRHVF